MSEHVPNGEWEAVKLDGLAKVDFPEVTNDATALGYMTVPCPVWMLNDYSMYTVSAKTCRGLGAAN